MVITLLLATVFLAFLDAINNMHLHRKARRLMYAETQKKLVEAAMKLQSSEDETAIKKEVK